MLARLALESDKETLRALGKMHCLEITPHLTWDDSRAEATFQRYLDTANPTIFVVERNREVVGHIVGLYVDNAFTSGFSILLDLIYVRPDLRGTRAAALLMKIFTEWADRNQPDDIFAYMANERISAKTQNFLLKFGFTPSGNTLSRKNKG